MNKKVCITCLTEKPMDSGFYLASNKEIFKDGRIPICKSCLKEKLSNEDFDEKYKILRLIDKPFNVDLWEVAEDMDRDTVGAYFTMLAKKDTRDMRWEDSVFGDKESNNKGKEKLELIDKWGPGYRQEEYRAFEQKYKQLTNNYSEKTAMHTEALLTYIRYKVKSEIATADGQVKDAKEWGTLASKAASDAKINPNQLSKSDLSDGLDSVGQIVRAVEEHEDIIPILPQFISRPQDKVDFTIWSYISYVRNLQGLPLIDYKDIYQFYEERKKEYALHNPDVDEGDF